MVKTFAAISVDPYQMELGIYEMSEQNGIRLADHVQHTIGVGVETYSEGKITYEQLEEMCEVLEDFSRIMKEYQTADHRAYAAAALRDAVNANIVLDQIHVRTGIEVRIISDSELRLINYKAIAAAGEDFENFIHTGTVVATVGFGSTQLSLFDKDMLRSTQTLHIGVMELCDMAVSSGAAPKEEHEVITEMIDNELVAFRKMYLKGRAIKNMIAAGEPILNLITHFGSERIGEGHFSAAEFQKVYDNIRDVSRDQLEDVYDLNAQNAALLFPTVSVFKRIMDLTGAENIWLPGTGMTDAIAVKYAEEQDIIRFDHDFDNDIIGTCRNMAKRFKCYMPHIQAVERLALQLFDSLIKYHGLGSRERLLLQIASDLHDIGRFITMRDESTCAYNMIIETEIIGLSHMEKEIVANVVRYLHQEFNYEDTRIEATTDWDERLTSTGNLDMTVAKLTAMLRLADAMDRGSQNKLAGCSMTVRGKEFVISAEYGGELTLEKLAVDESADFFREIFGIRPVLRQIKRVQHV